MAKASTLATGMDVRVISGAYASHIATVIDPRPIPDGGDDRSGSENQRKVLVSLTGVSVDGRQYETYVLPRLLSIRPTIQVEQVDHMAHAEEVIDRSRVLLAELESAHRSLTQAVTELRCLLAQREQSAASA